MTCNFLTVDVFTATAFNGAQIAVVPDAKALSAQQMQNIAGEFNLWRTVFITNAPSANQACNIRIFNAKKEFDFGGHATIGAIHAIAKLGLLQFSEGSNDFVIKENYGDVACNVEIKAGEPIFQQFTSQAKVEIDRFTPTLEELSEFLSTESYHFISNDFHPLLVASHLPYLFIPVDNCASLSSIHFDYKAWATSSAPATFASAIFLFSMSEERGQKHFHCRLVGPNFGLHEDPPIGAAMPAFAAYLNQFAVGQSLPFNFIAQRGVYAGRKSELHVEILAAQEQQVSVKIGGEAVLVSNGEMFL
ncbi:MAG: PhzF family phenazine biosynthesis protein [Thalassotalea sp.]